MLLYPTTRGAHLAYCDADCARTVGAVELRDSLEVDTPRQCLTCHACAATIAGSHCLCQRTGTSCVEHVWQLSHEAGIMVDVLSKSLI